MSELSLEQLELVKNLLGEDEIIRNILNYEKLYAITNKGRVWSYRTNKFLRLSDNGHGYQTVVLYGDDNKKKTFRIHRLVAEAFVPKPEGMENAKLDVAHLDDQRDNNVASNLCWMTRAQNLDTEHFRELAKNRKYTPVRCVETGIIYKNQTAAAKAVGIHRYGINNALTGKQKTAGGYHWERVEEKQ